MLNLKQYRDTQFGLPDLLNIAFLIDEITLGDEKFTVGLQKDGSLIAGFSYHSPDLESLSKNEIENLSIRINAAILKLGENWIIHNTSIRREADGYIDDCDNHFSTSVPKIIDLERKLQYQNNSLNYITDYYFTLTWVTPVDSEKEFENALISKSSKKKKDVTNDEILFKSIIERFKATFDTFLNIIKYNHKIIPLDDTGLISHISECLTGKNVQLNPPQVPAFLDSLIGCHDFIAGLEPSIDGEEIKTITVLGYPNFSFPEILEAIHSFAMPLRYTIRYIPLDQEESIHQINKIKQNWFKGRQSIGSIVGESLSKTPSTNPMDTNNHAVNLAVDANTAIQDVREGYVNYGYFTLNIILREKDSKLLEDRVKTITSYLNNHGFNAFIETVNAVEAFLGSIPGQIYENIRRPMMHSKNVADFIAKTKIFAGHGKCPSNLMNFKGKKAPPLLYAATTGNTPYRLNLHVSDLGHTFIGGPTGAGKSTLLALLAAQWLRYKNSRVISFDKGNSIFALNQACKGLHFDINGEGSNLTFAPLQNISDKNEQMFAETLIQKMIELQGVTLNAEKRNYIHEALNTLAKKHLSDKDNEDNVLSLTSLNHLIQDNDLKKALQFYTESGSSGNLFDSEKDGLNDLNNRFITFELEHLLTSGDKSKLITVPTLLYIFHKIEMMLNGDPTLILLDESWVLLDNEMFVGIIKEWLKVLRKKNGVVVFATQSLADIKDSPLLPVIMESCPTKIFLPNSEADSLNLIKLYQDMGLKDRQIELLKYSTPKKDYYVFSKDGQRRINLNFGPVALAFCGVSDPKTVNEVRQFIIQYKDNWPAHWLRHVLPKNMDNWAVLLNDEIKKENEVST